MDFHLLAPHNPKAYVKPLVAVVFVVCLVLSLAYSQKPRPPKTNVATAGTAQTFWDMSKRMMETSQTEKAVALEQLAISTIRRDPKQASGLWATVSNQADSMTADPLKQLELLDSLFRELDSVVMESPDLETFETNWRLIELLRDRMDACRALLCGPMLEQLEKVTVACSDSTKPFAENLDAFGLYMRGEEPGHAGQSIDLLLETVFFTGDIGGNTPMSEEFATHLDDVCVKLATLLQTLLHQGNQWISQEETALNLEAERDGNGVSVFPQAMNSPGVYQEVLLAAGQVGSMLELVALDRYFDNVPEHSEALENQYAAILGELEQLNNRAAELQMLRYNLWALQTMYAAHGNAAWPEALGTIDFQWLQPSVSTLYSITYDEMLRKETTPSVRNVSVRALLLSPKTLPAQF